MRVAVIYFELIYIFCSNTNRLLFDIRSNLVNSLLFALTVMKGRSNYALHLEEEKRSIIESFLREYVYGTDGEFLPKVKEIEYSNR